MAELADALDLGSSTLTGVRVRVPPFALNVDYLKVVGVFLCAHPRVGN